MNYQNLSWVILALIAIFIHNCCCISTRTEKRPPLENENILPTTTRRTRIYRNVNSPDMNLLMHRFKRQYGLRRERYGNQRRNEERERKLDEKRREAILIKERDSKKLKKKLKESLKTSTSFN